MIKEKIVFTWKLKIIFLVIIAGACFTVWQINSRAKNNQITYETSKAEKGTLITSISASGSINSGNSTNITTKVSGVVKEVYATNGDIVVKNQEIAEISLDDYALERQTASWVKYLEATEAVKDAEKAKETADIQMWKDRQAIFDAEEEQKSKNLDGINPDTDKKYTISEQTIVDKTVVEAHKAFTASEKKYLNAEEDIANAQVKVASALRDYQENSAKIVAPCSGTISDLMLVNGLPLSANSATSNTSGATIISPQTIGKISISEAQLTASVSLTEIDVVNVKANQKVTLTLDAFADKTFTGRVLAVNTTGTVSSGVTTYPVTILLDSVSADIYPNMAVNAQIITNIKTDVILVPQSAVTTANEESTVQVKKNGKISTVQVEVGLANDSQTEIKSGIKEGEEVVTSVISSENQEDNTSASPFSGIGRSSGSSNRNSNRIIQGGPPGF